jgi:hypothetical protein
MGDGPLQEDISTECEETSEGRQQHGSALASPVITFVDGLVYLCSGGWSVREVRHPSGPYFDRERSHEREGIGVIRRLHESGHAKDADCNHHKPVDLKTRPERRSLR